MRAGDRLGDGRERAVAFALPEIGVRRDIHDMRHAIPITQEPSTGAQGGHLDAGPAAIGLCQPGLSTFCNRPRHPLFWPNSLEPRKPLPTTMFDQDKDTMLQNAGRAFCGSRLRQAAGRAKDQGRNPELIYGSCSAANSTLGTSHFAGAGNSTCGRSTPKNRLSHRLICEWMILTKRSKYLIRIELYTKACATRYRRVSSGNKYKANLFFLGG